MTTNQPIQSAAAYSYQTASGHPANSATVVAPILLKLFPAKSVLDVGCGAGFWVREFLRCGVAEVRGLDGPWVEGSLLIDRTYFQPTDLTKPFNLGRAYDLVVCMEVAEHMAESDALVLLDSLIRHSGLICFSAAVPGQGGYGHINEHWQDYWIAKFKEKGYHAYEAIRPLIWNEPSVAVHYAQNIIIFSTDELPYPRQFIASVVHPRMHLMRIDPRNYSIMAILKCIPHYAKRTFQRLLKFK